MISSYSEEESLSSSLSLWEDLAEAEDESDDELDEDGSSWLCEFYT